MVSQHVDVHVSCMNRSGRNSLGFDHISESICTFHTLTTSMCQQGFTSLQSSMASRGTKREATGQTRRVSFDCGLHVFQFLDVFAFHNLSRPTTVSNPSWPFFNNRGLFVRRDKAHVNCMDVVSDPAKISIYSKCRQPNIYAIYVRRSTYQKHMHNSTKF